MVSKKSAAKKSSKKDRAAKRAARQQTDAETEAVSRARSRPVVKDDADVPKPDKAKVGLKGLRTVEARNPGTGKVPAPHKTVAVPTPRNDLPNVRSLRKQAAEYTAKLKKIKPVRVVALERGYYNNRLWEAGEKFEMKIDPDLEAPRWVALVKGKSAQTPDEEFGPDEDDTHDEDKDVADDEDDVDDDEDETDDDETDEDDEEI